MNIERKYDAWLPITSYNKIMKVLIVKMCELTDMSSTMLRTLAIVRGLLLSNADVEMLVLSNNELQKKFDNMKLFIWRKCYEQQKTKKKSPSSGIDHYYYIAVACR